MKSRNISSHSGTYLGQLYPERLCFSESPSMFYMWYSYFLSGAKAKKLLFAVYTAPYTALYT